MKAKLTKLWSFLLSLVMLLSLLPTTALAASPNASSVFVDGDKNFYNSTRLYYKNGDSDGSFTGTSTDFNAAYDPATGTLTLKGYDGKGITVGGVGRTDITVVLEGTNIINDGSLENAVGGDITVTSSDGGTLSITRTLSGSNAAIGIETGLSASYTTGNVTIKGNAKVTINMTHNGTKGYDNAYGIFAKENITISENASVDITCATPNNTTGGGNCNGLYAAKDVTIDTNGKIEIDVRNAGEDSGYSFGVYPMGTATLTKVGEMEVQWKKHTTHTSYPGGVVYKGASLSDTDYAINVDETNCYASYRKGTPYTVTVKNGDLAGPGVVSYAKNNGNFLAGDTVNIKPYEKKSNSGEGIPFQKWTSLDVTITNSTSPSNSFIVPGKNVTVTAMHSPFVGAPVFTRMDDSKGTIAFQTVAKPDGGAEYFEYVKVGKENDPYEYRSIAPQPTTASTESPYEYSVSASSYYTGGDIKNLEAGDYRMAVTLNGEKYLSDPFTVNYTAPVTTYTVSFNANGGTGTMADVTDISGGYTLPANGFTAPAGKQFKAWSVGGVEKDAGDKITVTANTTVTAVWEDIPVVTYTVSFDANGGTGTMADVTGVSGEYTLPANGFTAPDGKQFKAWSVGGSEKAVGDKITVTANTTVTAVWEAVEYNVTVTGGTASVGAGTPITKATMGTTVTLTAGAAPSGQMFDKWVVENGDITLADATSATTTFTMLAGEVSVKATYKDAPHTHTFDQKTIKDAALKTAADCTHDAVYYKSCSCGEISTNDADAFTATDSALGHDLVKTADAVNPTCVSVGWTAGYKCSRCDYEVRQEEVAKIAHTTKTTTTRATVSKDGKIVKTCTVCGKTVSTTVIPKISSIKLSATSYVYNGKVKTPSVTVKNRTGKTLVKNTDYTVSYAKGRKNVGKYAVKITFKGKYSGTKTLYFNVKPKSTSIASLSARSKGFYVKWNKQATQTTGYQIQYSTSSKFTKSKTVTISKNSTTSKTISKLTGKKKYYVRVRTYKTVKINGKATKIYSSWSKVKYVTTKA